MKSENTEVLLGLKCNRILHWTKKCINFQSLGLLIMFQILTLLENEICLAEQMQILIKFCLM